MRKKPRGWLKLGMRLTKERVVKRTKTYSRTLMINCKIKPLLNKLLNHQLNRLSQPLLPMKIDQRLNKENQQIYSHKIKVNMIETLILSVISIKIGKIIIIKVNITPEQQMPQLCNLTILPYQTHG